MMELLFENLDKNEYYLLCDRLEKDFLPRRKDSSSIEYRYEYDSLLPPTSLPSVFPKASAQFASEEDQLIPNKEIFDQIYFNRQKSRKVSLKQLVTLHTELRLPQIEGRKEEMLAKFETDKQQYGLSLNDMTSEDREA